MRKAKGQGASIVGGGILLTRLRGSSLQDKGMDNGRYDEYVTKCI